MEAGQIEQALQDDDPGKGQRQPVSSTLCRGRIRRLLVRRVQRLDVFG